MRRVGAADQQIRAAHPMTGQIDRQAAADDHLPRRRPSPGRRPRSGRLGVSAASSRRSTTRPRVGADQLLEHHGLELRAAVEQLGQPVAGLGRALASASEDTVGLNAFWVLTGQLRAAYASSRIVPGVGSYRRCRRDRSCAWPGAGRRCRRTGCATRRLASRHLAIMLGQPCWSGQAWIDSARYSYAAGLEETSEAIRGRAATR